MIPYGFIVNQIIGYSMLQILDNLLVKNKLKNILERLNKATIKRI